MYEMTISHQCLLGSQKIELMYGTFHMQNLCMSGPYSPLYACNIFNESKENLFVSKTLLQLFDC